MRDAALIVAASLAIALAAQVSVHLPFTPVPVTGQTFAVLLTGMLLGSRRAGYAVVLYLAEGALGLPVFAGGAAGLARLSGLTAGYLVAMPFAACLAGWLSERGWDSSAPRTFLAMLAGSLVILSAGTLWLSVIGGSLPRALAIGFLPFVPAELMKAALAAAAFPSLWSLRGNRS